MSVHLTLGVEPGITHPRVTPPSAEARFGEVLARSATALGRVTAAVVGVPELAAARTATAAVPAGGVAALRAQLLDASAPPAALGPSAAASPTGPVEGLLGGSDDTLYYLQLQERVSAESRHFTTVSNVMKARHDTAKVCINNIG